MKNKEIKQEQQLEIIQPIENQEVAKVENQINSSVIESWNMIRKALSKTPDKSEIKVNSFANDSRYLTIGNIESKLDLIYSGLWKTSNFKYSVIANEIVGSITLEVFIAGAGWISREGVAGVMIQQIKDSDITNIGAKIKNTLAKDFPHLKAQCIKNAAQSLGDAFGRSLNRDSVGDNGLYYSDSTILQNSKREVLDNMTYENMQDLGMQIFKNYELQMNDVEKKELMDFIKKTKVFLKSEYLKTNEVKND